MDQATKDQVTNADWPALPYDQWRETCATLHLWTQIVGKIRLALTPWQNHSWHVPLYVTAQGLSTSLIPYESRSFQMQFNFIDHVFTINACDGASKHIALQPRSVADFYSAVITALAELSITASLRETPCEIAGALRFSQDHGHAAYDASYVQRFWRVLLQTDRVFKQFRTGFIGKSSPVHFFWGSFDLAVTRFSGRRAPPFAGNVPGVSLDVMREAYSHEVSSAGFWPGGNGIDYPAFYSYAYPQPDGFRTQAIHPEGAFFHEALGEFLLPYEVVRKAENPEAALLTFLDSTYAAAANAAHWDRTALECPQGLLGIPHITIDYSNP